MSTSYLSEREVAAIQTLHRKAPYLIQGVSRGMFSVARLTGGMKFQGCDYEYLAEHDECIRADVRKRVEQMRRKDAKAQAQAAKSETAARQGSLGL